MVTYTPTVMLNRVLNVALRVKSEGMAYAHQYAVYTGLNDDEIAYATVFDLMELAWHDPEIVGADSVVYI